MKTVAFFLLMLAFLQGRAQEGQQGKAFQDSLLKKLPAIADDTIGVRVLVELSYSYGFSNADEGLRYARRALALARKIGWRKGEALALNELGSNYRNKAIYPAALDNYFKSLRVFESLNDRPYRGTVMGNIGTVYYNQKNYDKALEYFSKGLEDVRAARDSFTEVIIIGNMANVAYDLRQYDRALEYMRAALAGAERLGDTRGIITQLGNIGNVYGEMGDYREALKWYFKTLRKAEREGDRQLIAANEGNIGITYLDLAKDTARALSASEKSAYLAQAVSYLERGIAGARAVHFTEAVLELLQRLSDAQAVRGDYHASLTAYRQYTTLKDSTFNLQNNELIAGLETKRALELKNKDIQIATLGVVKRRNERWFFIAGIAALLVILGILFRTNKKQRHSNVLLSREKNRSDALLLNILPAEVAEELKETGTAHAQQYNDVSVLFTDFADFTHAAQQLSPQALVKELHECFTAFDTIVGRNGLEKIKTIGDAYMAVCGLPVSDPQHAKNAVQAALEILHFVEERRCLQNAFEVRIGIHSGPVVAGIVGVKKFAYDIWGDTVNTAARMEQHGIVGAINISQTTYNLVKADFPCTYRGKVAAKHKGEVEMYLVKSRTPSPTPHSEE